MIVFGYLRVSTSGQVADGQTTLEDQERIIRGVCLLRRIEPDSVALVSDVGVSGSVPLSERPGGIRLLSQLRDGDMVIAAKLDRMFRNAGDAIKTAEGMKAAGIELILADLGADPVTGNGMGKCFFTIAAAFAELERTRIAERMADGRAGKRAKGGFLGGEPPYGWRVTGEGRSAMLEEDETEQRVIRKIAGWRSGGVSYRRVLGLLAIEGIVSRSGKPFSLMQLGRMMREA